MKLKLFTQISDSQSGFTLLELLVASVLGLMVLGLALSTTLSSKNLFNLDVARTRINQDLRGALDFIGSDVRVAGENLPGSFPAIMIINGADDSPDELILRRSLLDDSLKVCVDINQGSGDSTVVFSVDGSTDAGCAYPSESGTGADLKMQNWKNYRQEEDGIVKNSWIYNRSTDKGEWFTYIDEANTGLQYYISTSSGNWSNSYTVAERSMVYIMEEWHFKLIDSELQLFINGQTEPYNVASGINGFQIKAILQDNSVVSAFDASQNWKDLKGIEITATGKDRHRGKDIESSLTARFFPRNILSSD